MIIDEGWGNDHTHHWAQDWEVVNLNGTKVWYGGRVATVKDLSATARQQGQKIDRVKT